VSLPGTPTFHRPSSIAASYAAEPLPFAVKWSNGQRGEGDSVDLNHGPFDNVGNALEIVGTDENSVIVRHDSPTATVTVYTWDVARQGWAAVEGA
jgi:hypothetical protein